MTTKRLATPTPPALSDVLADPRITTVQHPRLPLMLAKYDDLTQITGQWSDTAMACRGIVYDTRSGAVISFPFTKFFNLSEITDGLLPDGWDWQDVDVLEKLDGSMVSAFLFENEIVLNTNGSFQSAQALAAYEFLPPGLLEFLQCYPALTLMFEFIHQTSQIVIPYPKSEWGLKLIAARIRSGATMPHQSLVQLVSFPLGMKCVMRHLVESPERLHESLKAVTTADLREGFVLHHLPTDQRVKVKTPIYCELHALMSGVHPNRIWDLITEPSRVSVDDIEQAVTAYETATTLSHAADAMTNAQRLVASFRRFLADLRAIEEEARSLVAASSQREFNLSDFARNSSSSPRHKMLVGVTNALFRGRVSKSVIAAYVDMFNAGDYYTPYSD